MLHVGHARNYAMGDVVARFKRARGFNGRHPMGWDAGPPAENAAAARGVDPAEWTNANSDAMRAELKRLAWPLGLVARGRHLRDPAYYGQQQAGSCACGARGWSIARGPGQLGPWSSMDRARQRAGDRRPRLALGRPAGERRKLTQWFMRITDYADVELLEFEERSTAKLDKAKLMQEN